MEEEEEEVEEEEEQEEEGGWCLCVSEALGSSPSASPSPRRFPPLERLCFFKGFMASWRSPSLAPRLLTSSSPPSFLLRLSSQHLCLTTLSPSFISPVFPPPVTSARSLVLPGNL